MFPSLVLLSFPSLNTPIIFIFLPSQILSSTNITSFPSKKNNQRERKKKMKLLQCHFDDDTQSSNSNSFRSGYSSSSSSSSSSFTSQRSLQSLPSLSSPDSQLDQKNNIYYQCISTLKGHTSYVFSLVLHGKHLYSGSSNEEIRVWPREQTLTTHYKTQNNDNNKNNNNNVVATSNGAVKSLVAWGDKLFSAHQDHKIRVWKIDNNNSNNSNSNNNSNSKKSYQCVANLPTMNDRFGRLFSAKNYIKVRRHKSCTWVHHVDTVSSLALSADGSLLYSASWDRSFKVWRTSDFKCLESVSNAHDDAINAITSSPDGYIYTGSADKTIKVWKKNHQVGATNHSLVATLKRHKSAVNALALSKDGSVLYSGACDRSIVVWAKHNSLNHSESGGEDDHMVVVGALRGHTKAILCLTVVSDLLCSGSADNTIRVWKRTDDGSDKGYTCLAVLQGHTKPVKCITAMVDPKCSSDSGTCYLIYSGSLDCDIKVWKIWVPFQ